MMPEHSTPTNTDFPQSLNGRKTKAYLSGGIFPMTIPVKWCNTNIAGQDLFEALAGLAAILLYSV